MEKSIKWFTRIGCAVIVGLVVSYCQLARGGYSVSVNSLSGKGTVTAKVISHTGLSNTITTPFMLNPGVAINKQSNSFPAGSLHSDLLFSLTSLLPVGSDPRTYVQVRASSNYWASIQSTNYSGDFADSPNVDLLQFIIPRSACAGSDVQVVPIQTTANSITFQYKANLSDEGSAVMLRVVDMVTGQQKYVVLLVGPYDNTAPDNCEGTVTVTGDVENLNMLLDGTTGTLPFNITCPPDQVLSCSASLPATYDPPAVASGDTGPYTITYDKLPADLVLGITNVVTATARDASGCTVSCQFKVYRQAITFDGFDAPIGGADATGGTCQAPLRTYKLGNVVPIKFAMSCNGLPVTTGNPIITIQKCSGGFSFTGPFQFVNNEWHFNIDSTVIGTGGNFAGNYMITATLPDGSFHTTVLQYKK